MNYCLSKAELFALTDSIFYNKTMQDPNLEVLIEKAKTWDISLYCLVYFFSMILENKLNNNESIRTIIEDFYGLDNLFYVIIQDFDTDFIDFLLKNKREKDIPLEDELIQLQNKLADNKYGRNFRF